MLFEKIRLKSSLFNKEMRLYHTMRTSAYFNTGKTPPESRFGFTERAIVSDKSTCKKCEVFNEHLVYLFYGRPAFKWEYSEKQRELYPLFFVFRNQPQIVPHRIFPFDTGAFKHSFYPSKTYKGDLNEYALNICGVGLKPQKVKDLVNHIWGTKKNYYLGAIPDDNQKMTIKQKHLLSERDNEYLHFVYSGKYSPSDSRAFSIEYQMQSCMPLDSLERVYVVPGIAQVNDIFSTLQKICKRDIPVIQLPYNIYSDPYQEVFRLEEKRLFG